MTAKKFQILNGTQLNTVSHEVAIKSETDCNVEIEKTDDIHADKGDYHCIQYGLSCAVVLTMLISGLHNGWIAPTLVKLQEPNSTITVTNEQAVWVSGFRQIGSILGPFPAYYLADTFGRKRTIIIANIPNLIAILMIYFAANVEMLYAARFFSGLSSGISNVAIPIYLTEISVPSIRGTLGMLAPLCMHFGILVENCLVPFTSIKLNALICFMITLVASAAAFFVIETPYFYIMVKDNRRAEETLKYLHRKSSVQKEMEELKRGWEERKTRFSLDIFKTRTSLRCVFIIVGLCFAEQFSGVGVLNTYFIIFLQEANSPLPDKLNGIVLCVFNLVFVIVGSFLVDKLRRKFMFISSFIIAAITLFILGAFFYLKSIDFEYISNFSLMPIIMYIIYTFGMYTGAASLLFVFYTEIFPLEFKATAGLILNVVSSILWLGITKLYQVISDSIGLAFSFWLFGICSIFSIIFVALCLPETKGKQLGDIQDELKLTVKSR